MDMGCNMDMDCSMDMDMQYGHELAAWTSTCTSDMDM
jgi:hypothetical protein